MYGLYEDISSLGRERRLVEESRSYAVLERRRAELTDEFEKDVRAYRADEAERGFTRPRTEWQCDVHYFIARRKDVEHAGSVYRA